MEIDETKIIVIPSDIEIPVHNNPIQTQRPYCTEFPENSILLDKIEAIKIVNDIAEDLNNKPEETCVSNIPTYLDELQAVFNPLDVTECESDLFKDKEYKVIDNIDDLKKYLSELLIRFDTDPKYYTKEDFASLLRVLYKSLLFIYKETTLGPNISQVATIQNKVLDLKHPVATAGSNVPASQAAETLASVDYVNGRLTWGEIQCSM